MGITTKSDEEPFLFTGYNLSLTNMWRWIWHSYRNFYW